MEEVKSCKCGCGEIPKDGNEYVNHHHLNKQKNPVLCPLNGFKECMKAKCGFFEQHQWQCVLLSLNSINGTLYRLGNKVDVLNERLEYVIIH